MSPTTGGRWRWLLPCLVGAVVVAAFLPVLGNGFVNWDDDRNFTENPEYRGLGSRQLHWMLTAMHMGHYTPLTWLTLGIDFSLWGMDARGYHLTSLLLHAAAAVLLYLVALRLLRAAWAREGGPDAGPGSLDLRIGAAAAALLWGAHPLRVESVAWLSERRDVLSGALFLAALLAYLAAVDGPALRRRWYAVSVVAFAGALAAKASTLPLPVVLIVLDVFPLRRLGGARGWRIASVWLEKVPFVVLAAAAALMAFRALATLGTTPTLETMPLTFRAVIAVYALAFYLIKTAVPLDLLPLYSPPIVVTWLHFAIVAAGGAAAIALRRWWPGFTVAACAYVLLLLPVLRLVQGGPQVVADRYAYLSCLGWSVLAGAAASRRWAGTGVVRAATAAGIVVLAALTWQQAGIWRSATTLWSHAVAVNPENRTAHFNLARAHAADGRLAAAVAHYEETGRRSSRRAFYDAAIGDVFERAGLPEAARDRYVAALRERPTLSEACHGLMRLAPRLDPPPAIPASCPPMKSGNRPGRPSGPVIRGDGAPEVRGNDGSRDRP